MKPKRNVEQFVANIDLETHTDRDHHVLESVLKAHEDNQLKRLSPTWRLFMKNNTTKLATAATILLAIGLTVVVLDRTATPAWALDQTIEALKNIQAVYIGGHRYDPQTGEEAEFELWARPQSDDPSRSGDCRLREGDHHLCIAQQNENITYVCQQYMSPNQEVVYITEGLNRGAYMFPSGDLLAEFKAMADDWREEIRKDPQNGRQCVYVTFVGPAINTACYWTLQFDLETKLPVRVAVWFDADRQGRPHYEFSQLQYDPEIPEDCFDFVAPADAQIVDCRELDKLLADRPGIGISVDQLEPGDACMKVVRAYWEAVLDKDWDAVQTLRPLATGENLATFQTACADVGQIAQVSVAKMNHLGDPGTFAEVFCDVTLKNNTVKHSLLNVDIRDTDAGRMGVVAGTIGPEFYEAD